MTDQNLPPEFVAALTEKLFADKDASEVLLQTLEHMVGITPTTVAQTDSTSQPVVTPSTAVTNDAGVIAERRQGPTR